MATVKTAKASRDYPAHGIKKGDTYWWCKPYRQAKRFFRTYPRPSQTISSPWLAGVTELGERLDDLTVNRDLPFEEARDEVKTAVEEIRDEFRTFANEAQEGFDNLPENFQIGEQGERLEQRATEAEECASNLEGVDFEIEVDEPTDEELEELGDQDDLEGDPAEIELAREDLRQERIDTAFDELEQSLDEAKQYTYEG